MAPWTINSLVRWDSDSFFYSFCLRIIKVLGSFLCTLVSTPFQFSLINNTGHWLGHSGNFFLLLWISQVFIKTSQELPRLTRIYCGIFYLVVRNLLQLLKRLEQALYLKMKTLVKWLWIEEIWAFECVYFFWLMEKLYLIHIQELLKLSVYSFRNLEMQVWHYRPTFFVKDLCSTCTIRVWVDC